MVVRRYTVASWGSNDWIDVHNEHRLPECLLPQSQPLPFSCDLRRHAAASNLRQALAQNNCVNVKKRNPFINTQHVTKEPEVTESGEIPVDPGNSKWGTISMFVVSVKHRFWVRIDRSVANHWNSSRILGKPTRKIERSTN